MNILGINTSGVYLSVAISDKYRLLCALKSLLPMVCAEDGVLMIENGLVEAGLVYSDLDAVAIVIGPGSFTGMRVGASIAHALAISLGVQIIGVTTFDVIYHRAYKQVKVFDYLFACIPSVSGMVLMQVFDNLGEIVNCSDSMFGSGVVVDEKLSILRFNYEDAYKFLNMFSGETGRKGVLCGSGAHHIIPSFDEVARLCDHGTIVLPRFPEPDSRFVCQAAYSLASDKTNDRGIQLLYF
jgi:tRNA threonylcarbamoyl adenosine modification protein YeaZ